MKRNLQHEQDCAERLVRILAKRIFGGTITIGAVWVEPNGKTKFLFMPNELPCGDMTWKERYGRNPGLELDWKRGVGDVDEYQFDGDFLSLAAHGWQILKKRLKGNREVWPSELLRRVLKQERPTA